MTRPHFTAAELAGMPGLPGSEFRTRAKLDKLGVPSRLRGGREGGGGREFDASYLPAETRAALLLHNLQPEPVDGPTQLPATVLPTTEVAIARPHASRAEQACADGRATLVRRLADITVLCGGLTRAVEQMAQQLQQGVATPELLQAARDANQRLRQHPGQVGVPVSARSLFAWHTAFQRGGWPALLPQPSKPQALTSLADDVTRVLKRYASTAGSARNLTWVAQAITLELGRPLDDWRSLYDRSRRALPKLDRAGLIKARHSDAQRAARLPFLRRDASVFGPLDIGVCDGHSFKADVRHPVHGQPFTPEVTIVMDVATRLITGWSASLSESTIAVGDAMRHSVGQHGIYALMYTDNGSGEKAKYFDCPVTGLFERLGTAHKTGRPRHPQGHGVIERSWRTHMIRCASQFATFHGKQADEGSYRDTKLALAREQRAVKRAEHSGAVVRLSAKCPSWQQFLDAVAVAVAEYNDTHRHRKLPRHADGPLAGRNMTPREAWTATLVPEHVQRLDAPTLRDIFMPAVLCTAQRGEVRFLNQHYFSHELMQVDGERVRVHYDIHDPAKVWVWTVAGRFVCEAAWNGNRIDFFPKAVVEMARERRTQAAVKRRQAQIETAMRELQPTVQLPAPEASPFTVELMPQMPLAAAEQQMVERDELIADRPDARPFFDSASDRYEWLMRNRDRCTDDESAWLSAYADGPEYSGLRDYFASRGLEWPRGDDDQRFDQAV